MMPKIQRVARMCPYNALKFKLKMIDPNRSIYFLYLIRVENQILYFLKFIFYFFGSRESYLI
jgi:hypothetical protein